MSVTPARRAIKRCCNRGHLQATATPIWNEGARRA